MDRLLIRPASGRQTGAGLFARTNHWKDIRQQRSHSRMESRTKSNSTTLARAPDGAPNRLTVRECCLTRDLSGSFRPILRSMRRQLTLALAAVVFSVLGCWSASAATAPFELRIYDPTGGVKIEVPLAGVVRSSATAGRATDGSGTLSFLLTTEGASEYNRLAQALVKRGARLHKEQRIAVEVDGRVIAKPLIDYRVFQPRIDAGSGIQMYIPTFLEARQLAAEIRRG